MTMKSRRSLLAVPATSPRFLAKAAEGPADAVAALNQLDWGRRIVAVRVNGFGTPWGCRDILDVVEACPRLDHILLPKCETPGDVHADEVMIRSAEQAAPRERAVGIMGLIETA